MESLISRQVSIVISVKKPKLIFSRNFVISEPLFTSPKKIAVMAEPRDKIDGKDFAMLRSKGKKKKKKSMMGCYS